MPGKIFSFLAVFSLVLLISVPSLATRAPYHPHEARDEARLTAAEAATVVNAAGVATNVADLDVVEAADAVEDIVDDLKVRKVTYNFSTLGGLSTAPISLTAVIPSGAIIVDSLIDVIVGMTSAGGSGKIEVYAQTAEDLLAAVDADTLSGLNAGIPVGTAATAIKMTADRTLYMSVGTEDLTAGKFDLYLWYLYYE